uniref:G_PROTEIN_RECEP_F1_2 domain-containing protein n=1 Tax=Panagrellus redivivus TaxID=6233 RepID=A0A7E4ZRR6_PANRE
MMFENTTISILNYFIETSRDVYGLFGMPNATTYPTPIMSNFINYRSFVFIPILIVSIVLSIFVNYVILTQSKTLGTYKYYIINQTVWSQLFEIGMILYNPVVLMPYIAGYSGGIFRSFGTYESSAIAITVGFCLYYCALFGAILSFINRYILAFRPESKKYLESKYTFAYIAWLHGGACAGIAIFLLTTAPRGSTVRQVVDQETHGALNEYLSEPTFVYFQDINGSARAILLFCALVILGFLLLFSLVVIWFIANVFIYKRKATSITKLSRSLIICSLVQLLLCVVFLFCPYIIGVGSLALRLENGDFVNALCGIVSLHGTADILSTLYFIVPYRKFCVQLLKKKKLIIIVPFPISMASLMNKHI